MVGVARPRPASRSSRTRSRPVSTTRSSSTRTRPASSCAAGWGPDWPNASTVIPPLFTPTGGWDLSQVDDKAFNAKVHDGQRSTDRAAQAEQWKALNKEAMQNVWAIPTLFGRSQSMAGSKVHSASGTNGDMYFWAPFTSWPYDGHVRHAVVGGTSSRASPIDPGGRHSRPPGRGSTAPRSILTTAGPTRILLEVTTMASYIVRRLVAMVLMLIALSMIVFLLFNALPADPARLTCGKACTPQVIEANRHRLGLDKPLYEQYGDLRQGHLRRPHLRVRHRDLRVPQALPGLLVPPRRAGHRPGDQGRSP